MKQLKSIALGVALTAVLASAAAAQWNVERFGTVPNRVYSTFGLDPALIGSLGYARVFAVGGHAFQLSGDAGAVVAKLDASDFRARLGTETSLIKWRSLHVTGSATFITRGTDNSIYRALDFGADLTGALGVYRHQWFAAAEIGKDKAIVTHIRNSDWYRANFYPEAKNGWYLDTGGTLHYGLIAGTTLGRTEVVGRAGWLETERYNALTPPMYASIGLGVGF